MSTPVSDSGTVAHEIVASTGSEHAVVPAAPSAPGGAAGLLQALNDELTRPFAECLASMRRQHANAREHAQIEPAGEDGGQAVYFAQTQAGVLAPLRRGLASIDPGARLQATHERMLRELVAACAGPTDAAGHRGRAPPAEQLRVLDEAMSKYSRRLAEPVAALEAALTRWTSGVLRARGAPALQLLASTDAAESAEAASTQTATVVAAAAPIATVATTLDTALEQAAQMLDALALPATARPRQAVGAGTLPELSESAMHLPKSRALAAAPHWIAWYRQVAARLDAADALLELQARLAAAGKGLQDAIAEELLAPLERAHRETMSALLAMREEAAAALARPPDYGDRYALYRLLGSLRDRSADCVQHELIDALMAARSQQRAAAIVERAVKALDGLVMTLPPPYQIHALSAHSRARSRVQSLDLAAVVRRAYDENFTARLRAAAEQLDESIGHAIARIAELPTVLHFNLGGGLEELREAIRRASDAHEAYGEGLATASELVLNGLSRSGEGVEQARAGLLSETRTTLAQVNASYARAWTNALASLDRDGRQTMTQRCVRVGRRWGGHLRGWLDASGTVAMTRIGSGARNVGERIAELASLGRSAVVGVPPAEASRETLEALVGVDDMLAALPVVYRRLFSFYPVTDPALLKGRHGDLRAVARHLAQRRRGLSDPLLIIAAPGAGRSSFLNVMCRTVLRKSNVRVVSFTTRIDAESELVERLAAAFGLKGDDAPATLVEFEHALLARPVEEGGLEVCVMEQLAHVYRRRIGGTSLLSGLLRMMSATDHRIAWIATVSMHAWQNLEKSEPVAAQLVVRRHLASLDRADLEEVIMDRHRRSGLALTFEASTDANPILRRRLLMARSDARRQEMLRADWFDRLYALSGQNIMLALLYWVRAVEPEAGGAGMRVSPLRPLNFRFIDALPLEHSFALKALLEHATLTVEEYRDVGYVSLETARDVFGSLANSFLIAPVEADEPMVGFDIATIDMAQRYRVRPLIVHPIMQHLRARNIAH